MKKNKPTVAVVPGSFDPITVGHIDIIQRAASQYDTVYVAVMINSQKKYMFTMDDRLEIARLSLSHIENVEVIARTGMLIDLVDEVGATAIVKGIRNSADLEYEMIHAKWNKEHNSRAETLFLPADESLTAVSSTEVRRIIESGEVDRLEGIISEAASEYIKKVNN